jgi:hypothetical protein
MALVILVWYLPGSWAWSDVTSLVVLLPVMLVAVGLRWVLTRIIESFDQAIDRLAKKLR